MSIDLTPLVQALSALALAALTSAAPFLAPLLRRYLHMKLSAAQAAAVQVAAEAGAKAAYGFIAMNAASYRDVPIRNVAMAKGVQHVMASAPDAMTALGLTPDHVQQMVEARFGGLLAADPSISIANAPASAPATPPAPAAAE